MSETQKTRRDNLAAQYEIGELLGVLFAHFKLLTMGPVAVGLLALGVTFLIAPAFTAVTTFVPPERAQRINSAGDNQRTEIQALASSRLIERLRAVEPTGRVVRQLSINSRELLSLLLEGGDSLYVPSRPGCVVVFGTVCSAGSDLHSEGRELGDYLRLAGGPTKGADGTSPLVVRAKGQVFISRLRETSRFRTENFPSTERVEPNDTISSCPKKSTSPPCGKLQITGPMLHTSLASTSPA